MVSGEGWPGVKAAIFGTFSVDIRYGTVTVLYGTIRYGVDRAWYGVVEWYSGMV